MNSRIGAFDSELLAQQILIHKEYPIFYTHTVEVLTKAGISKYNIPEANTLHNEIIIGLAIRIAHPDEPNRRSISDYPLLNINAAGAAHVSLEQSNIGTVVRHPLQFFVHEYLYGRTPGTYAQLWINKGFDPSSSQIAFSNANDIVDNEAIELTFYWAPADKVCF